jgi:hypothetical protein
MTASMRSIVREVEGTVMDNPVAAVVEVETTEDIEAAEASEATMMAIEVADEVVHVVEEPFAAEVVDQMNRKLQQQSSSAGILPFDSLFQFTTQPFIFDHSNFWNRHLSSLAVGKLHTFASVCYIGWTSAFLP